MKTWKRPVAVLYALATSISLLFVSPARAFTQKGAGTVLGNGIPMGHEWITRLAAVEVIPGGDPVVDPDPNDPRKAWGSKGRAKNVDISSPGAQAEVARIKSHTLPKGDYAPVYAAVYDAIVGERWVDIGGFNVTNSFLNGKVGSFNCWDAVAQEPPEIQYDHFMRRYDDRGPDGGVRSARDSQQRFINYFVAAATAPSETILVWDGGGYSAQTAVDMNYFLFGRAVHLFEDSFSSEHTVRISADNLERVRQVKSYLCANGSEQHSHTPPTAKDFSSGDAIWIQGTNLSIGWASYKPSAMKTNALVATEAMRDVWAAFIRTMGTPAAGRAEVARREAATLVANWLSFDEAEMRGWYDVRDAEGKWVNRGATYVKVPNDPGPGETVEQCMNGIDAKWGGSQQAAVDALAAAQRVCLFNIAPVDGYSDVFDTEIHMPFNWWWIDYINWHMPTPGWQIPNRPADTGMRVRFRNVGNGQYLTAGNGLNDGSPIVTSATTPALDFVQVAAPAGTPGIFLRSRYNPWLFLSYSGGAGGDAKLYYGKRVGEAWIQRPTVDANYRLDAAGPGQAIFNFRWQQYMWVDGSTLRLTRSGNKGNANAQFTVETP